MDAGSQWLINEGERRIGRAAPAQRADSIQLPDDSRLSEEHAYLFKQDNEVVLQDAGSKNGSFVNGVRVEKCRLQDTDILRLGSSLFILRLLDSSRFAAAEPVVLHDVIFRSPEMHELRTYAEQLASADDLVLLLGETGTGKERIAHYIHNTHRRDKKFVAINCASLTPELADSALFGHERGAFTGAGTSQLGAFREAGAGTLFLDEVGELPPLVQSKLLRALAERKIMPVGSAKDSPFHARVIAATNRDLDSAVSDGGFRPDLLYRLRACTLEIPPLRVRREDILPILSARFAPDYQPRLNRYLVERLLLHRWPDNARGVVNLAQHFQRRFPQAATLELQHLPSWLPADSFASSVVDSAASSPVVFASSEKQPSTEELLSLLQQHRGNKAAIARHRGASERTVGRWLAAHGLEFWQWRRK